MFDETRAAATEGPREPDARVVGLAVTQALAALPFHQRQVVVLSWYHGMSYAEIGELPGLSTTAVKQRAFQAMRRLKQRLSAVDPQSLG